MKKIAAFVLFVTASMLSFAACVPESDPSGEAQSNEMEEDGLEEDVGTAEQALGTPNWSACTSDGACESGWCGCNGGTARVCLPSTAYPKYCANWTACWNDAQCGSGWCGCNGGNIQRCLPNTSYPKGCSL